MVSRDDNFDQWLNQSMDLSQDEELDRLLKEFGVDDNLIETPSEEVQEEQSNLPKAPAPKPVAPKPTAPKPAAPKSAVPQKTSLSKTLLMYLHDIVFLLAGIVVVFLLLFRVVVVSGTSMNNTLYDGDYLLLMSNVFYRNPKPGDVIVASKESYDNGLPIVKRVIATEGQTVDIDFQKGIVYVDGKALDEPYTHTPTTLEEGVHFPLIVDKGCIFVMGDNRNGSKDSRHPEIGQIDRREVLGKVVFLAMPGTNHGQYPMDFHRIGVVS